MLSRDLARLQNIFNGWITGTRIFSNDEAFEFERELRHLTAQATMLELGIDLTPIDLAAQPADTNVRQFPTSKARRRVPVTEGSNHG